MLLAEVTPEQSGFYSKLILDYLHGKEQLMPFYKYPHHADSFQEIIANKTFDANRRKVLSDVLATQYAPLNLEAKSAVQQNLNLLKLQNTYTVTTGHQLCLLTGPVYFLFKILHTIRVTEDLKKNYPDKNFVPVFWMASEDHDFAEVNSINANNQIYSWNHPNSGHPVGHYDLEGIEDFFTEIKSGYPTNKWPSWLQEVEKLYKGCRNLSEATFKMVHALFGELGLVILEPNNKILKQQLVEVMESDIIRHQPSEVLNKTNERLRKLNYKEQIHGREINFFYLSETGRHLIKQNSNLFQIGDKVQEFTMDEMKKEIHAHPERFSPNVVLRPVYQELILPNLAYVGGPGEISYWLQLKDVFGVLQVDFPVLLLRNSFAIINHSLKNHWDKLNLPATVYFGKSDSIHVTALQSFFPTTEKDKAIQLGHIFQELIDETERLDNRISADLIKKKKETMVYLEQLEKRIREVKGEKEKIRLQQVYAIRDAIFVAKTPAERVQNLLQFVKGNDHPAFIKMILENTDSITSKMKLLVY